MRTLVLSVVALVSLFASGQSPADRKDWIQLFNGKNLDGWAPKITGYALGENYADTFRVANGILQASYDKYSTFDSKFGHLFYERQKFSHYIVAAEYRFVGEQVAGGPDWAIRNNGLMLHSQSPQSMGKDQDFPDLGRGPAPRRSAERQAALDRQHVLARHAGLHQRHDGEGALPEFEVADLRRRPVGARRGRGARRRAPDAQSRRADRARVRASRRSAAARSTSSTPP